MTCSIESIVDEWQDGIWRSSALIGSERVWFESASAPLTASGEALGSAVLIPALLQGLQLQIQGQVCARWGENVLQLSKLLTEAWGHNWDFPLSLETVERKAEPGRLRGQFFSGGVDSFYELLTAKTAPDALICLQGFDMQTEDTQRFAHLSHAVTDICAQRNLEPVFLKTNVKENSLIGAVSWDDAHGGVLAAIGHLLSGKFDTVVIPPSWAQSTWRSLWGSHWRIDPLFSSARLDIVHGDATVTRGERIMKIAGEPLVRKYLRVCWSQRADMGNCSACAKCVRTMAVLHDCGQLENFSAFDTTVPIWERIDQVPFVSATLTYDELLEKGVEPKLEQAIRRLIKRSYGAALQSEYLVAHNRDLIEANQDLERQVRALQQMIEAMSRTRVWKAGKVLRNFRRLLGSRNRH